MSPYSSPTSQRAISTAAPNCRHRALIRRRVALALIATSGRVLVAQAVTRAQSDPIAPAALRVIGAKGDMRLDAAPAEPAWSRADSITDFRQREPLEGATASERTVVKVLRDAEALYVAVYAYDRNPPAIRASQLRRDADLSSDDNITVLIDSFHDRRSAFVFQTNPNGAMWDAQFSGVDILNENWNGIWEVAVSRDTTGWIAKFRIPFRTLRFQSGAGAVFGFNVRRFIRRKNEETLWRGWGRTQGLYHLLAEGDLVGLGVLQRARNVTLMPYALARAVAPEHDSLGTRLSDGFLGGKGGIDAKMALSPTLTADLTVNTDFAQVEADQQVINLTRFPLFFPEKREFFLESSGIFAFGTEGRAQLFYSRRIGLDTLGAPYPILGGGRVTGRAGPWTLGVLDARTGGLDQANDAVIRVKHDLLERSYIGAMLIDRGGPGVGSNQRAGGFDVDFPLVVRGYNIEPSFWIAGTQNPSVGGTPLAWRYGTDFPNDLSASVVRLMDAPTSPFDIFRTISIDAGRYWWTRGRLQYQTSLGRPVSVGSGLGFGGSYNGRSVDASLSGTWRGGGHLILGVDPSRNEGRLASRHF